MLVVHINFRPLPFEAHSSHDGYILIGVCVDKFMQPSGENRAIIVNKGNDLSPAVDDTHISGVAQAFGLLISDDPYIGMLPAIIMQEFIGAITG
jgi:hypothetical protein